MDDHIVQHFLRGKDQPPVKVQVSIAAAAPPAGLLLADGDAPLGYSPEPRVVFCLSGENITGDLDIAGAFRFGQGRPVRVRALSSVFFRLLQMLQHPVLFLEKK